eukprot:scaffold293716_cov29-Attheya_sp.AAC.1
MAASASSMDATFPLCLCSPDYWTLTSVAHISSQLSQGPNHGRIGLFHGCNRDSNSKKTVQKA